MSCQTTEHRFAGPSGEICWFKWGEDSGPMLLLLHATGFHARCWDQVVAALPEGLHVIAPDLRGHGRSYRPATLHDWSATVSDIVALVSSLTAKPIMAVGHSMGGFVASQAAGLLPDSFSRLLLVDPVLMSPEVSRALIDQPALNPEDHPVARRRNVWDSADQMIARFSDRLPYSNWRLEILADYCRYGLLRYPHGHHLELACPPHLEASAYLGAGRIDPFPLISKITCPVTILRARNAERLSAMDFSISPTWPDLASKFADGRDLHWPDLSHFIPMEAPDRLAALIVAQLDEHQG